MRNRKDALPERVTNPVVTDLDMLRAFVYRVFEIDQGNRAEVVNTEISWLVRNKAQFTKEGLDPSDGLCGVSSSDVLGLSSRERDGSLLS